jgi:hypothetical protein
MYNINNNNNNNNNSIDKNKSKFKYTSIKYVTYKNANCNNCINHMTTPTDSTPVPRATHVEKCVITDSSTQVHHIHYTNAARRNYGKVAPSSSLL